VTTNLAGPWEGHICTDDGVICDDQAATTATVHAVICTPEAIKPGQDIDPDTGITEHWQWVDDTPALRVFVDLTSDDTGSPQATLTAALAMAAGLNQAFGGTL
jgi:hypothetical protein